MFVMRTKMSRNFAVDGRLRLEDLFSASKKILLYNMTKISIYYINNNNVLNIYFSHSCSIKYTIT